MPNSTTKKSPFELIIGFIPRAHQVLQTHEVSKLAEQSTYINKLQLVAQTAIKKAQKLMTKQQEKNFTLYKSGDKVWLKGTNITMTHSASKLAPRWHKPFEITNMISKVVYKLKLPPSWRIHDVFYASLLSPYHKIMMHGPNYHNPPPPDVINKESEWEVEIMGSRRFRRKKLQF
jgi:hypothetical protein